jgi:uncharacterized protein YkwD
MTKFKTSVSAVAVALFLVACGGGGDSSAPAPVGNTLAPVVSTPPIKVPALTPVVTLANIQTTVPPFSYVPTSEEYKFVTAFNQFRTQVGLGLLSQNPLLDKAAGNHLAYVLKNDVNTGGTVNMSSFDITTARPQFHIESADKPLFTGVQEIERAKSVGYSGAYIGEQGTFGGGTGAQAAFDSLTSTIYHRAGLLFEGPREVGIAVGQDRSQTFVMEVGYASPQSNASDFIGIYPGADQTGVGLHTGVETPNPFPDLSTANADFPTKTGYPVSVMSKAGTTIEVLTFTLTAAGSATPLDARLMTRDNDPNRYLPTNFAFLAAKTPLKTSTTYTAKFSGRVNNVLVNKEWKFTTRS